MIKSLYLKNFALFDEINIHFENGLNIITGETGSGKSLLLKSLKYLSGERFSKDFIRQGENRCVLEVEFEVLKKTTTIRRVFHLDGKSRSFLNDEPISIEQLKELSESLLDYHGQHENQKLFRMYKTEKRKNTRLRKKINEESELVNEWVSLDN